MNFERGECRMQAEAEKTKQRRNEFKYAIRFRAMQPGDSIQAPLQFSSFKSLFCEHGVNPNSAYCPDRKSPAKAQVNAQPMVAPLPPAAVKANAAGPEPIRAATPSEPSAESGAAISFPFGGPQPVQGQYGTTRSTSK